MPISDFTALFCAASAASSATTSDSPMAGGSASSVSPRMAAGTVRAVMASRLSAPIASSIAAISPSEGPR